MSAKRVLNSRDLLSFRMVDDPQVSPDGTQVAWVRTWIDPARNCYRSSILLTAVAAGSTRSLTRGEGLDTHPRWSPDGRFVAYLSASAEGGPAADGPQLFVVPVAGGEARQLTRGLRGIQDPEWSPDGTRLAFTMRCPAEQLGLNEPAGADMSQDRRRAGDEADPYTIFNRDVLTARRMKWKMDGMGFLGDERRHVATVAFQQDENNRPLPRLLTRGHFDLTRPVWSPDGTRLAVVGNIRPDADRSRRQFIYLLEAGSDEPVQPEELFGLEDIRYPGVAWSPDGAMIAVAGHDNPAIGHYGTQRLWLVRVAGGAAICLTPTARTLGNAAASDLGRYEGAADVRWLPGGSALLALVSERGTVQLCRIEAETGAITPITMGDHLVTAFTLDAAGQVAVALIREPLNPGDLYVIDLPVQSGLMEPLGERPATGAPRPAARRRLTRVNDELLGELRLSTPQRFTFNSSDAEIDGWILPPVGRAAGVRVPAVLYHGGGPGGMRGSNFMFEYQLYAAQGYAVVYCNARGCQGYGETFCTAILGRWGGPDYEDNLNAIRAACNQFDFIDPERLGTAGGSYGGYQVNWIIGHTDMFQAAVSDRSVSNRYSSYGTSDIGYLREFEFDGGPPWETTAAYLRQSPLQFIGAARTPTLVIHSARDLRCPVEQGEQLYMALKRLGVPTELVRFPNETHDLSRRGRPWHRVFRLDKYLEWFGRWL